MRHFFEWFSDHVQAEEPWLILGKGPTFSLRERYDLGRYHLLSLNHAVREQPVLVAHAIDLNVIESCSDVLERQARFVVMPWYPHVRNRPGAHSLADLRSRFPVLQRLSNEGRLLWYDLSTSPIRHGLSPVVQATYFSAEAGLSLLALAGARRVRTLGVDGGTDYSRDFEDLRGDTLLANGRASFDLQFEGFANTILATGVEVAPLQVPSPVRIYVADAPEEALPAAVLRHSIRRHASLSVDLEALPAHGTPSDAESPAILLTPRAQCLVDIRPIWMGGAGERELVVPAVDARDGEQVLGLAMAGPGLGGDLACFANSLRVGASAARLPDALQALTRARLDPEWNPDARYQPGRSRFVRYESDGSEPWLSRANPIGYLWIRDLLDGVARGAIPAALVASEIRKGHVRPSLGYQVEHGIEEALLLPRRARRLDREFRPAKGRPGSRPGAVSRSVAFLRAIARQAGRPAWGPGGPAGAAVARADN